jgi:hypothetical protein
VPVSGEELAAFVLLTKVTAFETAGKKFSCDANSTQEHVVDGARVSISLTRCRSRTEPGALSREHEWHAVFPCWWLETTGAIICRALQPRKVLTPADLCQSCGSDRAATRNAESRHIMLPCMPDLLRLLGKPCHSACHIFCRSRFETGAFPCLFDLVDCRKSCWGLSSIAKSRATSASSRGHIIRGGTAGQCSPSPPLEKCPRHEDCAAVDPLPLLSKRVALAPLSPTLQQRRCKRPA